MPAGKTAQPHWVLQFMAAAYNYAWPEKEENGNDILSSSYLCIGNSLSLSLSTPTI